MARQVIGIDFGTTKSSLTFMDIGSSERPIPTEFGGARHIVPTVLILDSNDQSIIGWGWDANGLLRSNPKLEIKCHFKRDLGNSKSAEDESLLFLSKLSEKIRHTRNVEELVEEDFITVIGAPANWEKSQLVLLKNLAMKAGFPAVRVHPEPVAAMHNLRCQSERRFRFGDRPEKYMVIDFGGGTLDICVVQTDELGRNPKIVTTDGDPHLGGIDFDDLIQKAFIRQCSIDHSALSPADKADLFQQIQDAKESFSEAFAGKNNSAHYTIHLPSGDYHFSMQRVVFENLCRDQGIFRKIEMALDRALKAAGIKPTEICRVVLTGGSSKWYFVKEIVSRIMGLGGSEEIFSTETPFTDVACGLAILIGRSDEPPDKPGVFIRCQIDGGEWSERKVVLAPGRVEKVATSQRLHLGSMAGSKFLFSRSLKLEWSYGLNPGSASIGQLSTIRFYTRSNHPKFEKLLNAGDALRGKSTQARTDAYQLFLLYREENNGFPRYLLEIQDNRDRNRTITVVPGEDGYYTRFGLGKHIRFDHDQEVQHKSVETKKPKRQKKQRKPFMDIFKLGSAKPRKT